MTGFAYPYLWLLLLLPFVFIALLPAVKGLHGDALRVPFLRDLNNISLKSGSMWYNASTAPDWKKWGLCYVIYALLVCAAARPQWLGEPVRIKNEGRDILLVMDISTSMLEPDFRLNGRRITRLQAVKAAASNFIDKRKDDRIGIVLFGSRAYLQAPLTFDKNSVKEILYAMDAGMAGNSTAIGDALGLSLKTLRDDDNKQDKVIILLTDGENNDGSLSLPQAIGLAGAEKVKIYTIGVGSGSDALVQSIFGYKMALPSGVDDAALQQIADETRGRYFKASDTAGLVKIYDEIDKIEPSSKEDNYIQEVRDFYYIPLLGAVILSLLVMFLRRRNR